MTDPASVARQYWQIGFNVIPVHIKPRENEKWMKEPIVEYKRWWMERQTEEEFNALPWDKANGFAVLCGTPNDDGYYFSAVDFDVINVSNEARQLGERAFRELPISQLEETPSGGKHNIYLTKKKASTRNFHDECALELLGSKKLCVMAPSEGYRRLNDNTPTKVENLEEKFFRILKRLGVKLDQDPWFNWREQAGHEYHGRTPPCIEALNRGTEEGNRNEFGIRLGSYLINFLQAPPNMVKRRLNAWNRRNSPPLQRKELEAIIRSASVGGYNYGCTDDILKRFCKRESCPIAPYIMVKLLNEEDKKKAKKILEDPKLMEHVVHYGRRSLIGEDGALIQNFVEICSGQTLYPISGMLKGFSGSGKNESLKAVMPLVPKEWVYWFTTSTPEALKYLPSAFAGTLIIYEATGVRSETGSLSLRAVGESQSIATIYPMRDEATGKMTLGKHRTNARNFITTDAGVEIEPQLYRRVLQRSMNSSTMLTKRVMAKKIRDAKIPDSLKQLLGTNKVMPYTVKEFRNALRLNEWKAEAIVHGGEELMKLTKMAMDIEQEVAMRTHVEKILNFIKVLALINQRRRVRVKVRDETVYVLASPQDWFSATAVLEPTIFETVSRLGKRQQDVLRMFKSGDNYNKHDVAQDLKVSTYTAARVLKVLANNGYLKEFKNTKPYHYELLRKEPEHLSILENPSEFEAFWLKECRNWLNTTFAPLQAGVPLEIIGDPEKMVGIPRCKVAKVHLTPKTPTSSEKKTKQLGFPPMPNEKTPKSEKEEGDQI